MREVCLVVPCFDEAKRLPRAAFATFLDVHPAFAICFVDDGSRDGTRALLDTMCAERPEQISVTALPVNGGKAAAVRAGMLAVASQRVARVIGYWDADLSTPLDEAERLLAALDADPACAVALGSRVKRAGAAVERRLVRHLLGRLFATLATLTVGLSVYDSQCGAKLFRASVVPRLFEAPFTTRWLFDLELLVRLQQAGASLGTAVEVPLGAWREVGGSKLKIRDMLAVPFLLLQIRRRR
ncbi:MAG: glycosyltransferase family 2 protein [Acidobacteriaceae bacterium]|jgi:glycosyltransferase involved in cell wall biosynthesis|nr:glycosyltransferase family 2 protein [Acidobacteriaceae bacterium]